MATHSSTLAWKIPWAEETGGLQFMGLLWVGHDWATSLSLFTFMHWRRKWQPTPVFLPGESQGQGSLVGCRLWGPHRVRHDWSDLAAAAAAARASSRTPGIRIFASLLTGCKISVGFFSSSNGKEYACNAGDPGSIPGSGRSPGEGNGNPL